MLSFKNILTEEKRRIFEKHDYYFFDVDGVLCHGGSLLPGVVEVLNKLNECGKTIKLFTNNCAVSREKLKNIMTPSMPFLEKENIISSAFLAAKYFENWKNDRPNKKIFVIGTDTLLEELRSLNVEYITSKNDKINSMEDIKNIKLDKDVGAVLLGSDLNLSFYKLIELVNYIRDPQVEYTLTHIDKFVLGSGDVTVLPGAGSFASAIESTTKRWPINLGKPGDFAAEYLRSQIPQGKNAVFIGDSINTDIKIGNKCGMTTFLVLTGVSKLEHVEKNQNVLKVPHYYADSIADFLNYIH